MANIQITSMTDPDWERLAEIYSNIPPKTNPTWEEIKGICTSERIMVAREFSVPMENLPTKLAYNPSEERPYLFQAIRLFRLERGY